MEAAFKIAMLALGVTISALLGIGVTSMQGFNASVRQMAATDNAQDKQITAMREQMTTISKVLDSSVDTLHIVTTQLATLQAKQEVITKLQDARLRREGR